jgi:hypothetical protein
VRHLRDHRASLVADEHRAEMGVNWIAEHVREGATRESLVVLADEQLGAGKISVLFHSFLTIIIPILLQVALEWLVL